MGADDANLMEERVMDALRASFRPEFLNRVDDIVIYHQLDRSQIGKIVEIQLHRVQKLLRDRRIDLELTDKAKELVAERGFDPHYGARPVKRVLQRMVQDPLAMKLLEGEFAEGAKIVADVGSGDALEFREA